ncbi:MAG: NAD(P)/FAD-dependent oxidoreductase [Bdellovibrionota bacterium]
MIQKHQVIIIGGGPGGSTAGSILARAGVDVLILERELYPRFHIGESLLPATMPIFKEIGFYPTLDNGNYIRKYGARFIDYQNDDEIRFGFQDGLNAEIPMAFEVERSHFDTDILAHAVKCGAKLHQPETVLDVQSDATGVRLKTDKGEYECDYLIDSTGRDALIGKKNGMRDFNKDLNNVAVFAHYRNVFRYPGIDAGDITIGLLPDRAWTWIIPFQDGITSVGVVASSKHFNGERDLEAYFNRSVLGSEKVRGFMKDAERVGEMRTIGNYSHTCKEFFGDRWILSGDAAVFLDPIFSSGVHMSCSSSKFAAEAVMTAMGAGTKDGMKSFKQDGLGETYEKMVRLGAKRFKSLIMMFYQGNFVEQMKKSLVRENVRKGFTSAVAGDVWNENNYLFEKNVL